MTTRRKFLGTTLAGSAAFAFSRYAGITAAPTADSRIEILPHESLGVISPNIYRHFTEHLGGVIYDGLWVGPKSKVPNYDGLPRGRNRHTRSHCRFRSRQCHHSFRSPRPQFLRPS